MNKITKVITTAAVVLAAGVASAQITIYSQDFASDPGITAVADEEGFTPTTYDYETWLHTRAVYDAGTQSLQVRSNTNGGTRGAGIALASSNFSSGVTYSLSFDVATVAGSNFPLLGVGVYEMNYGGTTDYRFDFVEAAGVYGLVRTGSGNTRTTVIPDFQISAAGSYSYDFTLSGNDDLCIIFSGMSALGNEQSVYLDNVAITAVPEPSTAVILAGFAALGLVLYRRRRA